MQDQRVIETTEQGVVDRVFSKSYIQILSQEDREDVGQLVRDVLAQSQKQWIDAKAGTFGESLVSFVELV